MTDKFLNTTEDSLFDSANLTNGTIDIVGKSLTAENLLSNRLVSTDSNRKLISATDITLYGQLDLNDNNIINGGTINCKRVRSKVEPNLSEFTSDTYVNLNLETLSNNQEKVIQFVTNGTSEWRCGMDNTPSSNQNDFSIKRLDNFDPEFVIDTNGNVGINNTTMNYKLDVNGDINTTGEYRVNGTSVLNNNTLGPGVLNSSLTSVGTLSSLIVSGVITTNNRIVLDDNMGVYSRILPSSSTLFFQVGSTNVTGSAADLFFGDMLQSSNLSNRKIMFKADGKVGIGTDVPSTILEVSSTTSGLLPPRMTETQRDNIVSPIGGEFLFNSTNNKLEYYNGSNWTTFVSDSNNAAAIYGDYAPTPQTLLSSNSEAVIDFNTINYNSPSFFTLVLDVGGDSYIQTDVAGYYRINYQVSINTTSLNPNNDIFCWIEKDLGGGGVTLSDVGKNSSRYFSNGVSGSYYGFFSTGSKVRVKASVTLNADIIDGTNSTFLIVDFIKSN